VLKPVNVPLIELTEGNCVETRKRPFVCNGIEFLYALQFVHHKSGSKNLCLHAGVSQK
jgi:hypothetical protein